MLYDPHLTEKNLTTAYEKFATSGNFLSDSSDTSYVFLLGWSQIIGSLSPFMHTMMAKKCGFSFIYGLHDIGKNNTNVHDLLFQMCQHPRCRGCNVTMPYKLDVYDVFASSTLEGEGRTKEYQSYVLDDIARRVGAVNTIYKKKQEEVWRNMKKWENYGITTKRQNTRTIGMKPWNHETLIWTNTDVEGIAWPIKQTHYPLPKKAVVLGGGGAARAVLVALEDLGISEIVVCTRKREKAMELQPCVSSKIRFTPCQYDVIDNPEAIIEHCQEPFLCINTLPFGFKSDTPMYPIDPTIVFDVVKNLVLYYDIVYELGKWPTPTTQLLQKTKPDLAICRGEQMLIHQAKRGFELWNPAYIFDVMWMEKMILG